MFPGKSPAYSRKRRCCSEGCIQRQAEKGYLSRNPSWEGLQNCRNCGEEITGNRVKRQFCGPRCRVAYFEEANAALVERRRREWEANPNQCLGCNEPIPYRVGWKLTRMRRQKFCSRPCLQRHRNEIYGRERPEGLCEWCGSPISGYRKFCGDTCKKAARRERGYRPYRHHKSRMKKKGVEYKGGKCQECGYNRSLRALHFHHLDPAEKDFNIGESKAGWETLQPELDKCALLCANCHAEVHDGLRVLEIDVFA